MTEGPGVQSERLLVEVVRGDLVESRHHVRAVVTTADGQVAMAWGPAEEQMYPRSSAKPLQAIAMLRHGLDLDGAELALAAASHSGEPYHLAGVASILAGAGLGVDDLRNTPDLPLHEPSRHERVRAGRGPEALTQNCSGKHAAMLRTCVRAGWPTEGYLDLDHPLQQAILEVIGEFTGGVGPVAVDGCGAPLAATTLTGLAHAFGRIAAADSGPEHALADAYRDHPEYASGTGRDDLALHRVVPGLVCKGGAEAVMAIGLPDGRGIAIKVEDGAARAIMPVVAHLLEVLDVPVEGELPFAPVLGHGRPAGQLRVATS